MAPPSCSILVLVSSLLRPLSAARHRAAGHLAFRNLESETASTRLVYAGRQTLLHAVPSDVAHDPKLVLPSTGDYNLTGAVRDYYSQWGQEQKLWGPLLSHIDSLQNYKPFFVESGARDGEKHSNSLFLEKSRGWHGLLVEPSNQEFPRLVQKKRKAWAFHGALSPINGPAQLEFFDDGDGTSHALGAEGMSEDRHGDNLLTKAEPLVTLLQSIQPPVNTVDFWSLDIEGSEGPVLESTDFSRVEVGIFMIEMNKGEENNARIRRVMNTNAFLEVASTTWLNATGQTDTLDHVFINPKYFERRGLQVPEPFGTV